MGRVHKSEISWTEHENTASQLLSIRAPIEVLVLGIDKMRQILNLSIKQCMPKPND